MQQHLNAKHWKSLVYLIAIGLITFITYRALNISVTFDEVASIRDSYSNIYKAAQGSANTQYLNSLLTWCSGKLFTDNLFFHRLPNVLAFVLYLWASFSISKNTLKKNFLLGVILLNCFPFVLDFFSISRGYGLSLGFCLSGIAVLIQRNKNITGTSTLSIILFILGALSNLTTLNILLVFLPIIFGSIFISNQTFKRKCWSIIIVLSLLSLFAFFIQPIISSLVNGNQLYFGGREGLIKDTIVSISNVFAYHQGFNSISFVFISALFVIGVLVSIINILSAGKSFTKQITLHFEWPFLLSFLSIELQHTFFETNYPVERTALFLIILNLLVIIKGPIIAFPIYKKLFFIPIVGLFALQFSRTINLKSTYSWRFTSGTKEIVNTLSKKSTNLQKSITVGVDILMEPPIKFCIQQNDKAFFQAEKINGFWETKATLEELNNKYYGFDFKLIPDGKIDEIFQKIKDKKYDYLYLLKKEGDEVLKRKFPYKLVSYQDYAGTYLLEFIVDGKQKN